MAPASLLRVSARQLLRTRVLVQIARPVSAVVVARQFSQSSIARFPRKDSQDRESMDTTSTEYSKSGTDDGASDESKAAYDPNITDPKQELKEAGKGEDGNPLDVSPANPEVSKPRGKQEGGAQNSGKDKQ